LVVSSFLDSVVKRLPFFDIALEGSVAIGSSAGRRKRVILFG
jgi:hypothetical protein